MRKKKCAHGWVLLGLSAILLTACGKEEVVPSPLAWSTSRQFAVAGEDYGPLDIESMDLKLSFDVTRKVAIGEGSMDFTATAEGFPYFLSDPALALTYLDEDASAGFAIRTVRDPGNENTVRVIPRSMSPGEKHRLHFRYEMPATEVTFRANGVGFVTAMADLKGGNFLDAYAPTSFEDDAYTLHLSLEVLNAYADHQFFANGEVTTRGRNAWHVEFPSYFTMSSFYWHVTDQNLPTRSFVYQAVNGPVPVTVYSATQGKVDEAVGLLPGLFDELEGTYGPYTHNQFIAYISGRGGMEHAGATITSIDSLDHELLHSWFARGVMPADGRSGWIDEAIASWRDYGYRRANSFLVRKPTNLGRFSPFLRFTPKNCYVDGRALLAEIDAYVADRGGLKPMLREFYRRYQRQNVRTEDFRRTLEELSGRTMEPFFTRYVYAGDENFGPSALPIGGAEAGAEADADENASEAEAAPHRHPPALTREEIRQLR